ncbi:FIVAR domain-containing protein [Candidatus Enterococcus ferrettii]|uniref:DUF5648 domain-containing protein n=1 Tax=Candidatus Enterococcus ferrettii TaxID=2815324 RepID=A0ABV0EU23_9ENTE|nr:FIVAR domain-containing protein [Enterococcus sp. 665A]MBO1339560.1 FIVAR domain-containing protein [Enterococcus sp. 665A]
MRKKLLLSILFLSGLALFFTSNEAQAASQTLFRVYNPNSGEHFYTQNSSERDLLVNVGWHDEGIAWETPSSGITVYRLYNPNAGDHHYTMDINEYNHLEKAGWRKEGEAFKSVDTSNKEKPIGIPVYRAYNPNTKSGAHNFTINLNEQRHLIQVGWKDEKVAFYAHHGSNDYFNIKTVHKSGTKVLKESTTRVKEGFNYIASAENFSGYELVGSSRQEIKNITSSKEIIFNYNKVNKDKLTAALKSVDALSADDYTPISWDKLIDSRDAAKNTAAQENATQKEVNDRLNDLNGKIKELVARADFKALEDLYLSAAGIGSQHYDDYATYLLFHEAYGGAYIRINDLNSSQTEVDDALNKLQGMIALAKAIASQALLDQLQALYDTGATKNQNEYTPASWNELTNCLNIAKDILDSERPIEETTQLAADNLQNALDNLILKPDKTDLQDLYDASQGLGSMDFDPYDDYLDYHYAMADAQGVLLDENHSQQRVDDCLATLKAALSKRIS